MSSGREISSARSFWALPASLWVKGERGEPVRATGTCRQKMIHDGRFVQSEFVFDQGGKKSTGLGIIGFVPETGEFTSFWTDSRQTKMSIRRSRDRFDGEQIVLFSRSLETDAPDSNRSKTVSRLEDGGRKLVHKQSILGPRGEERLIMELIMVKKSERELTPPGW